MTEKRPDAKAIVSNSTPSDIGRWPHVYVVDDDSEIRRSLHFALATSNITAWPFATPDDFLEQVSNLKPAPVLLDLRMPTLDGLQVLQKLRERKIEWPVIMISAHGDIPVAVQAMKLGAVDFLEKPFVLDDLLTILNTKFEELVVSNVSWGKRQDAVVRLQSLTPQEVKVLNILASGISNKMAAHELGLSARTIEVHRANALKKLGVRNIVGASSIIRAAGQQNT